MTFHASTIGKLRKSLKEHRAKLAETTERIERRQRQANDLREEIGHAEDSAAVLTANIADCERWLDFAELCDADEDLAYAFANAVLNRSGVKFKLNDRVIVNYATNPNHGTYGMVVGTNPSEIGILNEVLVEFDRDGTTHRFLASQLALEGGDEAAARENAEHDPRTCTECAGQHEAEQRSDAETIADAESEAGR